MKRLVKKQRIKELKHLWNSFLKRSLVMLVSVASGFLSYILFVYLLKIDGGFYLALGCSLIGIIIYFQIRDKQEEDKDG